jgi:hypothetical protein
MKMRVVFPQTEIGGDAGAGLDPSQAVGSRFRLHLAVAMTSAVLGCLIVNAHGSVA